jgi:hypothetical protein
MAFAVGGALLLGGASLAGSAMSNRTNRKIAEQAQAQNAQDKALTQQYAKAAMEQLPVGYQNAQAVRQQALGQGLGLAGQTFQPTAEMINQGGMMNQNALLAGLQLQRNAILGKDMDYSTLQAMSPQMDYSALSGLMNPQGLDFQPLSQLRIHSRLLRLIFNLTLMKTKILKKTTSGNCQSLEQATPIIPTTKTFSLTVDGITTILVSMRLSKANAASYW